MVLVHLSDGQTQKFDLSTDAGLAHWQGCQADPAFQSRVTGLGIHHAKHTYELPVPGGFRQLAFSAARLMNGSIMAGVQINCQSDDVLVSVTLYFKEGSPMARVDLRRTGTPRHVPRGAPMPQKPNGR